MKQIQKDELYDHLSEFLKAKGIELKEGPYTKGIHAGCSMLADAINLSQAGLERARVGFERGMDQMRQVIHEKTAPKRPSQSQASESHQKSTTAKDGPARKTSRPKKGSASSRRPRK
jgi:hypothetical protein